MFSIDGLVSGLDTSSIIEGLLSIQQRQLDLFESRKQQIQVKQTAFQGIEANVVALKSAAQQLGSFTNDVFSVFEATSSDESIVQAAASEDAVAGTYRFSVSQLATVAQVGSQTFENSGESIGVGEISIQVGDRAPVDIQINSDNNKLEGLAASINSATDDVTAAVINDGEGYRLLMTSKYTGADNQIEITDNSKPGELLVDFSGTPIQEAQDSQVVLGSGPGAITISRDSNTVEDVIPGLTLNLLEADPGKEISISVKQDNSSAREAIEGFVNSFNNVMTYIDQQTAFNAETEQAGLLLGNSSTNGIRNQLRGVVSRTIANVESNANRLSTIGVTFNDSGQLQIDSAKLDRALAGNIDGVSVQDVRRIFAMDGQSTSQGVSFISGTSDTSTTTDGPLEVVVTKAAERAGITATNSVSSSITIDASNDGFSVEVDGVDSGALKLTHGTYTQTELAEHLQSVINQSSDLGGRQVSVAVNGNSFSMESVVYGTRSEVGSVTGTAASALGFDGSEYDRGRDVSGYFIVDGETETANGNGQVLSGSEGNANTDGLQMLVTLNASQINGTHSSEMTITRGFASNMELLVDDLLDPDTGRFSQTVEGFEDQVASVDASVERLNAVFEARQAQLIAEFVAIETSINSLQTTSSFLAAQLGTASTLKR